jgi:hypothetical protein
MKRTGELAALLFASLGVGACALHAPGTTGRLEREIATIEARVVATEAAIDTAVGEMGRRADAIYSHVLYRPIVAWADALSAGPAARRTTTFHQTSVSGNLEDRDSRCRPLGGSRAGHRAWIDGSNVTRASVAIDRFTVQPRDDGLVLAAAVKFDARTQVKGRYDPPCLPTTPTLSLPVTGTASTTATFRLRFASADSGRVSYSLDMASPNNLGIELRVHLSPIPGRVGFTMPMHGLARRMTTGTLDLMQSRTGAILLPDGTAVGYRLATVNPKLTTSTKGIQLATEIAIAIDTAAVARFREVALSAREVPAQP